MNTLCMRCWLWARKRLVRPGPACVQPSWGVSARGNLPREAVGRALGGREPAKTLLLRSRRRRDHGCALPRTRHWFFLSRLAPCQPPCQALRGLRTICVAEFFVALLFFSRNCVRNDLRWPTQRSESGLSPCRLAKHTSEELRCVVALRKSLEWNGPKCSPIGGSLASLGV